MKDNKEDKKLTKIILELLYLDELKGMTYRFDIPRTGNKEQIIKNIMKKGLLQKDIISSLKVDGLRALCNNLNLKTGKKKEDMTASILQLIKEESAVESEEPTVDKSTIRSSIPSAVRLSVWRRYWESSMDGQCWVCGMPIQVEMFDCGHIISVSYGGNDNMLNLVPICRGCNLAMKKVNLLDFKQTHYSHINVSSRVKPDIQYPSDYLDKNSEGARIIRRSKNIDLNNGDEWYNKHKSGEDKGIALTSEYKIKVPDIYDPIPIEVDPGSVITSFNFDGNKYNVSIWKELLLNVAGCVLHDHKRDVDKILDVKGSQGCIYFSKKSNNFFRPEHIEGTDIYVETKLSAKDIIKLCYYVIRTFGYTDKDLKIRYH